MYKKCKQCGIEMSIDFFYIHPLTKDKHMWRCKECMLKWRRSDLERQMAREWEKKNRVRPVWYIYNYTKKYRLQNPDKYKAHNLVNNFIRDKWLTRKDFCMNCLCDNFLELHHPDYTKPFDVIALCPLCHKWHHHWKIDISHLKTFNLIESHN